MKSRTLLILALIVAVAFVACTPNSNSETPNPASVYCEDEGGTLEIRTDADGGQFGVCVFDDGSECEEWAFFRSECKPGDNPDGIDAP